MSKKIHPELEKVLSGLYNSPAIKDMDSTEGISKEDAEASREFLRFMAEQMSAVLLLAEENLRSSEDWERIAHAMPAVKREEEE